MYRLAIDIGIASLGFAAIQEEKFLDAGVHIFEKAEDAKTGASLATPRRKKRGLRRVTHRRASRKKALRRLFKTCHLPVEIIDEKQAATGKNNPPFSPWDARKAALERLLTDAELVRALFHIGAHRGFQSNSKATASNDLEGKKALSGAKQLEERMLHASSHSSITVGAYLATQSKKRNGDGSYENFITRDLLRQEIGEIFKAQQKFGQAKATEELKQQFLDIAFFQRPLQSSEHLVGNCALEISEKRAPKFSYSAELFVAWSRLNNCRIKNIHGEERSLDINEKRLLLDKSHILKSLSYKQARNALHLNDDERFNISYRKVKDEDNSWLKIRDKTESMDFLKLTGYHALKAALHNGSDVEWQQWLHQRRSALDDIARIISFYEDTHEIDQQLARYHLQPEQIEQLKKITHFSRTVDLSIKAITHILPFMEQGLTYDKACDQAGYEFNRKANKGLEKLPPFADIRNPVVNRALAQARKLINAMIRRHGMPETIIIEFARGFEKSLEERRKIESEQKKNQHQREKARKKIAEIFGILPDNVNGEDILKYRLWQEQQGFCPYSGVYISHEMLRDGLAIQIDHIIPYSRSWNDSYINKILCLTAENQAKGNQTPYEYLGESPNWLALEAFAARLSPKKAEYLLMRNFDDTKAQEWKSRALNDTSYMAKLLKSHLEESLNLGIGKRVQTRNGALTAHLRRSWGFPEKNRTNDRHHAIDALVLAYSTEKMVQELSNWNKYEARRKNPTIRALPPKPWDSFRDDILALVEKIFVSRQPIHTITGAAHDDTIRSIRYNEKGKQYVVQRQKLQNLSAADIENLVDKERNIKLYELLKQRMAAHDNKAEKAFATPLYMPSNKPDQQGPLIKSVNIITTEKTGLLVNQGLAKNGDMIRVDVFVKQGKFYLVPLYVHHFGKPLPHQAIMARKDEIAWPVMAAEDFVFSLYKNDLLRITTKKEVLLGYYAGTDRNGDRVKIRAHDNDPSFGEGGTLRISVKTALAIEKLRVNFFGEISMVRKEQRLELASGDDSKPCAAESM